MSFVASSELRKAAQAWFRNNAHRRWFLDYYTLPPNDPRYLSMTDDEITFDLLTVQAARMAVPEVTDEEEERDTRVELPEFKVDSANPVNKARVIEVRADEAEFKKWLEQEVCV